MTEVALKVYEGMPDHHAVAADIEASRDDITDTVKVIAQCADEFATLHTSLEGQDDTRAIVNDVSVCVTRQEALYAKSRELCAHYETLVKASKTLAERVNALNAVILPSDEETRVRSTSRDAEDSDKIITDDAFDADALRNEMEDTLSREKMDNQQTLHKKGKHRWWHTGTTGGLHD
jgi:hypothetical protein